ncbi:MAG: penicillin-binding protein 1C [SAR324 cluster bacterium]|nr:penicillin-binding protein 1C [SAR324 cluster bacterium]
MKYKRVLAAGASLFSMLCVLAGLHFLFPIQSLLEQVSFSKVYYDRNGQLLGARLSADEKWRFQSRLEDVTPLLVKALLTFEDQRFYQHHGVDFRALARAVGQNLQAGQIVSGASTLSMQVARLLGKERRYGTILGKVLQTFRAIQLEASLSKDEILQWYFNLAPYGGNIEGVGAASWLYFEKPPSQLSWVEAIALAITPKSPNAYRPDRFPLIAQKHCRHLLKRLSAAGQISEDEHWFIECSEAPGKLSQLPRHARHLINRLATGVESDTNLLVQKSTKSSSEWNHIRTSLDLDLQLGVESLLSGYQRELRSKGIHNASVIVLDNFHSQVLAYVGSPDFSDKSHSGEVDGIRAARSPGSTLKPFIYARALESGRYNSHTLLANVPVAYPGYHPKNFKPEDLGIAHFNEALHRSLNIPAVALNVGLGFRNDLLSSLWRAGVSTLPYSRSHYGQSLVLGGGEMRLDELTVLYSALARHGKLRPAHLTIPEQENTLRPASLEEQQWFTPEASFIISEILKQAPHPRYGDASLFFEGIPSVAWKTGTSSRQRDAWTVGYNPRYTVGVWVGNFNGDPVEGMTGMRTAAPLFYAVFRLLNRHKEIVWPSPPPDVVSQSVCSLSGRLANANCPGETSSWWIAGVSKPEFCEMHIELLSNRISGQRLSPECIWQQNIPEHTIQRSMAVLWPQATGGWLAQSRSAVIFPPYAEACVPQETLEGQSPLLHTPIHGENYAIHWNGKPGAPYARFDKIAFSAAVSNEVNRLDWYLNGRKIASTPPGDPYLWKPIPGAHELVLVDDFGRASRAKFTVYSE